MAHGVYTLNFEKSLFLNSFNNINFYDFFCYTKFDTKRL